MEPLKLLRKCGAEALGTFMLVLAVGCSAFNPGLMSVYCIATTLMVFIYALGGVSGGHFNPAVTLGVALSTDFGWIAVGPYMVSQLIGGLVASGMYIWNFRNSEYPFLAPAGNYSLPHALGVEFLYTLMLVFVVLNVAAAKRSQPNSYYGLAIGWVVVAGGYGAGMVSGGAFNPAISMSLGISSAIANAGTGTIMLNAFLYTLVELAGAIVAHLLYRVVRPEEFGACSCASDDSALLWASKQGEPGLIQRLVSEFLGVYFLVVTVGLNVGTKNTPELAGVSIAASLMCMIYALGNVSGAHFNPAVTVAVLASRRDKISLADAGFYILIQLFAGLCGGLTYGGIEGENGENFISQPENNNNWGNVFFAESLFTFVLAFVVLCVATRKTELIQTFAFTIGMCIVVAAYAIGPVSGAHLNPAVSLGIDTSAAAYQKKSFWKCFVYMIFQLFGALTAAGFFWGLYPEEFDGKCYSKGVPEEAEAEPIVDAP